MKRHILSRRVTIIGLGCCIGCSTVAVIVLVASFLLLPKLTGVDQQDYANVAQVFADSLLDNNAPVAKSLTTPEQWGRIDAWMAKHSPFSCPFSWDIDNETTSGVSLVPKDGDTTATYHYRYQCAEEAYSFSIDDIILERTEEGWLVVDWSRACESWDWETTRKCE